MKEKIPLVDLVTIKEQIDKLVEENKSSEDAPNFQALQNVLRLIINEESFRTYFEKFNEVILSMSNFDFSKRIPIDRSGDIFCYISTSLNLLGEELEVMAAPKHYLEETLNLLPEAAILANDKGEIQFVNKGIESLTKYKSYELTGKSLLTLFKKDFVEKCFNKNMIISERSLMFDKYLDYIPVEIALKKLKGPNERSNGFSLLIKKLGEKE